MPQSIRQRAIDNFTESFRSFVGTPSGPMRWKFHLSKHLHKWSFSGERVDNPEHLYEVSAIVCLSRSWADACPFFPGERFLTDQNVLPLGAASLNFPDVDQAWHIRALIPNPTSRFIPHLREFYLLQFGNVFALSKPSISLARQALENACVKAVSARLAPPQSSLSSKKIKTILLDEVDRYHELSPPKPRSNQPHPPDPQARRRFR
jgi:hypothetical protein